MKQIKTSSLLFFILGPTLLFAQVSFTKLANYGGGMRASGAAFASQTKLYYGLGNTGGPYDVFDFWEYNPGTNSWKNIPSPVSIGRIGSVSFANNKYGFVGLGESNNLIFNKSFYCYHFDSNYWSQIADFPGIGRSFASYFVIGNKAYVGCGRNGISTLKDFYCLDMETFTWSTVSEFPGTDRSAACSFSIENKGYVLGGETNEQSSSTYFYLNDFYSYDTITKTWSTLPLFPGNNRAYGVSFGMGKSAYLLFGFTDQGLTTAAWEFNASTNSWSSIDNFPGEARARLSAAVIQDKAYIVGGTIIPYNSPELYSIQQGSTGIHTTLAERSSIDVFPNPFHQQIQLTGDLESVKKVGIYDISGRIICESENASTIQIPAETAPGYYTLVLTTETQVISKKILKN